MTVSTKRLRLGGCVKTSRSGFHPPRISWLARKTGNGFDPVTRRVIIRERPINQYKLRYSLPEVNGFSDYYATANTENDARIQLYRLFPMVTIKSCEVIHG